MSKKTKKASKKKQTVVKAPSCAKAIKKNIVPFAVGAASTLLTVFAVNQIKKH